MISPIQVIKRLTKLLNATYPKIDVTNTDISVWELTIAMPLR